MRRTLLGLFGLIAGAVAVLVGNGGNRLGTPVAGSHPLGIRPVQQGSASGSRSGTGGSTGGGLPAGNTTAVGPAVQTPFGPVQVRVTFANGKITDAQAVQTPDSHQQSVMINQYATPILHQETLTAQSSNIDMVSGATWTSEAYAQSLQAAIGQVKK